MESASCAGAERLPTRGAKCASSAVWERQFGGESAPVRHVKPASSAEGGGYAPQVVNGASAQYENSPVARKKWRGRSIVSLILFLLATVLAPVAVVGHWGHETLTDTERYMATVGPIGASPEVQQAVGDAVTNAVIAQVDTEALVGGFLGQLIPNEQLAGALSGPLSSGINQVIAGAVQRFMSSDAFQTAWLTLNEAAQRSLIYALEGEPDGVVRIQGPDLVLDISSLLVVVQDALVNQGIDAAANITIPDNEREIVLMSSPAFEQLRTIWGFTSPLLGFILFITAALFTLSVLLATRRARTTVAVGVVVFLVGVSLQLGLAFAESSFTNAFAGSIFEAASVVFFSTFLAYLLEGLVSMMVLGVVLVLIGWFSGRTDSAVRLRAAFVRGFADMGSRLPEGLGVIGRPMRDYAPFIRWGLLFLWVIFVFTQGGFALGSTLGYTSLFLGLLTIAEILMHTPQDRELEIRTG